MRNNFLADEDNLKAVGIVILVIFLIIMAFVTQDVSDYTQGEPMCYGAGVCE